MQKTDTLTPKVNILGVKVNAVNLHQTLQIFEEWIHARKPNYVCVTPAHGVMECVNDPPLRKVFNASGLTTPDGMAIVWILKLLGYRAVSRVYGPDLLEAACQESISKGWKHFLYGGAPGIAEKLACELQKSYPGLQICGMYTPPYRPLTPQEDQQVIDLINSAGADIVWMGISTPKQEHWMAEHLGKLSAPVMVGVGAAFDFLSGNKKQAPLWMQRSGLEWLFRLATEPGRLWKRYIQYPYFVLLVAAQLCGLKKFPQE